MCLTTEGFILRDASTYELLSPAGNWDCARAAVENGANAIYFGLQTGFNARARAHNFGVEDLDELVAYLHTRGVRGFVTLNTLVFSDELARIEIVLQRIARSGVDAILVQDLGVAKLAREICPDLELHASTQMTLTSTGGIELAQRLGIARVVVPREHSIAEIRKLSETTDVTLEAFVHGALCVAYSGQCLTSESLGGRSANRGQCAQACRLPYEVICDGKDVELEDVKYLLSPQDLAAYALLPDLMDAGVTSFKIEGRLKTPEYVANVTARYRDALDQALAQQPVRLSRDAVDELELSFSRGFSPGWLKGCDHKMLVPGTSSAKRGLRAATVLKVKGNSVQVELHRPLQTGDGVVFDGDRTHDAEVGGRIWGITRNERSVKQARSGICELAFQNSLDLDSLHPGQSLWKTDDPQLTKRLQSTFSGPDPMRRLPVDVRVTAAVDQPLRIFAVTELGASCQIQSDLMLPEARKHIIDASGIREKLGRLGGTHYTLREVELEVDGRPMAPHSFFGPLRRKLVAALDLASQNHAVGSQREISINALANLSKPSGRPGMSRHKPLLLVLCRHLAQVSVAIEAGASCVYADFADIRQYRDAVEVAHTHDSEIYLATPRIEKPGELGVFRAMAKQGAAGILARNLGALRFFTESNISCIADFSLNAANPLTASVLREWNAERVTVSYDLNRDQILDMISASTESVSQLEVVIHQHMPMFHMEHCVFCAVLSPGTNKHNCGRPCDHHEVQLRDRVGMEHPLHADVGCRNTLYNASAQSSAEIVPTLIRNGIQHFRIELLDNSPDESRSIIATYRELLAGSITGQDVWKSLNAMNRVGVTRGTLEERRNPLAIL